MPQMSPMEWFYLYLLFVLIFLTLATKLSFSSSFMKISQTPNSSFYSNYKNLWMW